MCAPGMCVTVCTSRCVLCMVRQFLFERLFIVVTAGADIAPIVDIAPGVYYLWCRYSTWCVLHVVYTCIHVYSTWCGVDVAPYVV